MIHNVYCIGTGHDSTEAAQLFPQVVARYDQTPPDQKHLLEGVGSKAFRGFQAGDAPPLPLSSDDTTSRLRGKATGKGWGSNVKRVITDLVNADRMTPISRVNLVGHSRGAVTCHMIAHAIDHVFRHRVPCNIFAFDPVPGGITDFSTWMELSAGDRETLGLNGKTAEVLPANVRNYFGILMEKDDKAFFGILGAGRLQTSGGTQVSHLPMYGKHGDCVKSDLVGYPASKIALSLLLENLRGWGAAVDDQQVLGPDGYIEQYARLYRKWVEAGSNPKKVSNWSKSTFATGLGISLVGGLPALGFFSGYWRNRRADDIANDLRSHRYFLNYHHRDSFHAVLKCQQLAQRQTQYGWVERDQAMQFRAAYYESYVMLVGLEMMRSVNAPPGEVGNEGEYFIDVPPKRDDLRKLAKLINDQLPKTQLKVVADEVFTLEKWTAASRVTFGSRKDQVAEIDRLLPAYWQAVSRKNPARAQRFLYRIGVAVEGHLRTKPGSDRRQAMQQLARQVSGQLSGQLSG
jgi:hypothetical protein